MDTDGGGWMLAIGVAKDELSTWDLHACLSPGTGKEALAGSLGMDVTKSACLPEAFIEALEPGKRQWLFDLGPGLVRLQLSSSDGKDVGLDAIRPQGTVALFVPEQLALAKGSRVPAEQSIVWQPLPTWSKTEHPHLHDACKSDTAWQDCPMLPALGVDPTLSLSTSGVGAPRFAKVLVR